MKTPLIIIAVVIVLGIAWYLLSPLLRSPELNEASPLIDDQIKDDFEKMDAAKRAEFESAMEAVKDIVMEKSDVMPAAAKLLAKANFVPRAHVVEGQALLIEQNGRQTARFENFKTINGPKLKIYLASSLGDEDFVDLGDIRATIGNVNYEIPAGTDTQKYNKVLVWCKTFSVLFSYADLEPVSTN